MKRFRRKRETGTVSRETIERASLSVVLRDIVTDLRRNPPVVRHVVEHKPRPKPFGGWVVMRWPDGQESRQRIDIGYGWRTSTIDIPRGIHIMHIEWDKNTDG